MKNIDMREAVLQKCREIFGEADLVVRSPGRVNLIGGHTDYNRGLVLPVAIDREIWVAARLRKDSRCQVFSTNFLRVDEFELEGLEPPGPGKWTGYPQGVAWALQKEFGETPQGMEAVVLSNLPTGSGLSSSASIEAAFALLWCQAHGWEVDRPHLAQLCQQAENKYVGVQCGILDQMAVLCGRAGQALFLDVQSMETLLVSLPKSMSIVVADTGKNRKLGESAYNKRREECEEAVLLLRDLGRSTGHKGLIESLRDIELAEWMSLEEELPPTILQRVLHVVRENRRVEKMAAALPQENWEEVTRCMNESHQSLRDLYQVSSPELDAMQEACAAAPGCRGVRMTGAGFGGACVALVERDELDHFLAQAESGYRDRVDMPPQFLVCQSVDGATVEEV